MYKYILGLKPTLFSSTVFQWWPYGYQNKVSSLEQTMRIKIVDIPPWMGVNEHLRRDWVGVEIPIPTDEYFLKNKFRGVDPNNPHKYGYIVRASDAFEALQSYNSGSAQFWQRRSNPNDCLRFERRVCRIVQD